ncbi:MULTISPECIES: PEP-CTERM sorting domain-containing protein [unclassified Lentimonas]|uniref:PEP-CTERM sorting domain-containing protein n=1 Tax=unclassified Lentimonas TaxID=2630993 RepID=UPI0013266221|nr:MULTISPECIES: PEP-CTERM sorting domain-containing protein [unclassified Lentimonas]CAA6676245.1 Unannotated [Lentimonas sp. CC4]CAA6683869.1 Unannotated [Lentimonas sp. CC6]CAA7077735.1 Unannotated [Lentimonas sp. CC4]CAA7171899.1 Unannotated [Lentimonas sp. CC21]CAA7183539.1 Unannotated [Lentimonas sp. CC8]
MKKNIPTCIMFAAASLALVQVSNAAAVLIDDDFSSSNVTSGIRYYEADVGDWVSRYDNWNTTGTDAARALTADLSQGNNETPVELLFSVSESDTSLTEISISFDYTVPDDATLYFYVAGYEGPLTSGLQSRLTGTNGSYLTTSADDFNGHLGTGYLLGTGGTPTGGIGTALASLTNISGTFSQTYDISGFGSGGFNITDFDYMTVVFGVDTTLTSGSITVDNFNLTAIPEPGTYALLAGLTGLVAVMVRRRR